VAESPTTSVVRAAALAGPLGNSIADAVAAEARTLGGQSGEAWLALAAAWSVATGAGAPLAGCLRELAASFRQLGQLQRDVQVALAGPEATARMVMGLPVIGIVFGALMGFDTLRTLFATLPGLLCLVAGSVLMVAGSRWNARLVRSAQTTDAAPGLQLDLTAIAMAGGGSVDRARSLVRAATERYGLNGARSAPARSDGARSRGARSDGARSDGARSDGARSDGARSDGARTGNARADDVRTEGVRIDGTRADGAIDAVLDLSTRAGVPAAELLRSEANQMRRDARSEGQRKAATLAVTLMLPLGVCVLPAFMLVGVVPLLLAVITSTFSTF
jgi:tight adherence protein B